MPSRPPLAGRSMTTKSELVKWPSYHWRAASGLPETSQLAWQSLPEAWDCTNLAPGMIGKSQGAQPCTALGKRIGQARKSAPSPEAAAMTRSHQWGPRTRRTCGDYRPPVDRVPLPLTFINGAVDKWVNLETWSGR